MPSKYDTNPLDPEFPKKAGHSQHTEALPNFDAETRTFAGAPAASEDPTRRYNNGDFNAYSYMPPQGQPPVANQPRNFTEMPSKRKIEAVGLPENVLMILPYAPFYIGLVAAILELLIVPQSESKVRFHAAQGLALHIAIFVITFLMGSIGIFTNWARAGSGIFTAVAMVILVISMIRVWQGKAVHYGVLDGLTDWLSEKVKLQKN